MPFQIRDLVIKVENPGCAGETSCPNASGCNDTVCVSASDCGDTDDQPQPFPPEGPVGIELLREQLLWAIASQNNPSVSAEEVFSR